VGLKSLRCLKRLLVGTYACLFTYLLVNIFVMWLGGDLPTSRVSVAENARDGGSPDVDGSGDDASATDAEARPRAPYTSTQPSLLGEAGRYFAVGKTLEGLLMYTEGVDTPVVTISAVRVGMPRDSRLVANPMVRVSVKLPGKRAVSRSGWSLPLSASLSDAYGVERGLK